MHFTPKHDSNISLRIYPPQHIPFNSSV